MGGVAWVKSLSSDMHLGSTEAHTNVVVTNCSPLVSKIVIGHRRTNIARRAIHTCAGQLWQVALARSARMIASVSHHRPTHNMARGIQTNGMD